MRHADRRVSDIVKEGNARAVVAKVFDEQTINAVHELSLKGHFDHLEFLINVGKEAHVFQAVDSGGNLRAVKIYKIETSDFKKMTEYIEGDFRFKKTGHAKRDIVFAWTKKEYRNLIEFKKAGVKVPLALAFHKNVLVMEFIGEHGKASPTAKEKLFEDPGKFYDEMVESIAKMAGKAKLIHADLSEYNVLNRNGEMVVIDCGQAVPTNHPKAKEFFERDLKNINHYFNRLGIKKSIEEVQADIREKAKKL